MSCWGGQSLGQTLAAPHGPAASRASPCLAAGLGQRVWCKDSLRDGRQPCPSMDAEVLGCPVHGHPALVAANIPQPEPSCHITPIHQPLSPLGGGSIPRTAGKAVPVLPFSILGWSAWHQDLNSSPFPPPPCSLLSLTHCRGSGEGIPSPAKAMPCLLTQLLRHLFLLVSGLMLKESLPRTGEMFFCSSSEGSSNTPPSWGETWVGRGPSSSVWGWSKCHVPEQGSCRRTQRVISAFTGCRWVHFPSALLPSVRSAASSSCCAWWGL